MKNQEHKTTAARILALLIQELEIEECEIVETVNPHRITLETTPAKMEDYLCLMGKSRRTHRHLYEIIAAIANNADQRVLTWPEVTMPKWETEDDRPRFPLQIGRTEDSIIAMTAGIFGMTSEVLVKRRTPKIYDIELGHAESQRELASELKPHLVHTIRLIGYIHDTIFNVTLIPSAFEPEKQPTSAAGRHVGEVER